MMRVLHPEFVRILDLSRWDLAPSDMLDEGRVIIHVHNNYLHGFVKVLVVDLDFVHTSHGLDLSGRNPEWVYYDRPDEIVRVIRGLASQQPLAAEP